MKPPSSSTRLARWLGIALIALIFYAMLTALVLFASFVLLQRGTTPDLPWISAIQGNLYMKALRSIWQNNIDCVDFDEQLIYKPKLGACQFRNAEFDTTLNFAEDGRFTGPKPPGVGIAVVGDSHAMGWGVEDEETFAAKLQQLSHRPVYNLAVSSYGTVRELLRLENSGLLDKVDTVIIQYCDNDLGENRQGRVNTPEQNRKTFQTITAREQGAASLLPLLRKAYGHALVAPLRSLRPQRPEKSSGDFSAHHQALVAVLEKHPRLKSKRVLIFYSNKNGRRFEAYPVGQNDRLPHVEFLDIKLDRSDYFRLDDHLTSSGHAKLAQQLYPWLQNAP